MSKVLIDESNLQAIADSIRAKNGTQETYLPSEMSTAIDNISGGGGVPDWSQIGYEDVPESIIEGFNYAKNIYDNWDSSITSMSNKYNGNVNIVFFPNVDTKNVKQFSNTFNNCSSLLYVDTLNASNATSMYNIFGGCKSLLNVKKIITSSKLKQFNNAFSQNVNLRSVPLFDTSKVYNIGLAFSGCTSLKNIPIFDFSNIGSWEGQSFYEGAYTGCTSLTEESLHNIIISFSRNTKISNIKTLRILGLTSAQSEICTTFTEWQTMSQNGWTTGYEE